MHVIGAPCIRPLFDSLAGGHPVFGVQFAGQRQVCEAVELVKARLRTLRQGVQVRALSRRANAACDKSPPKPHVDEAHKVKTKAKCTKQWSMGSPRA